MEKAKIYLGLDIGTQTIGIAFSNSGLIARPFPTYRFDNLAYEEASVYISDMIKKNQVTDLVIGDPKNMNNTESVMNKNIACFVELLKQALIPYNVHFHFEDERLTSKIAEDLLISADVSRKKRKQKKDSVEALIILNSFLDKNY